MSETLIEDGSTYPTDVQVPSDGDARNAASVLVGFQALANRCKYFYTKLGVWLFGGTIAPAGTVTLDLSSGGLNFIGDDDFNINLGTGVQLLCNGLLGGHLFTAGRSGRANRKPQVITPAAGTTDIDPSLYNTIFATPSVGCSLKITPSLTVQDGDWIQVINSSTSNGAQVLTPAAGVPTGDVSPLKSAASFFRSAVYVYTSGSWRMAEASPYAP